MDWVDEVDAKPMLWTTTDTHSDFRKLYTPIASVMTGIEQPLADSDLFITGEERDLE